MANTFKNDTKAGLTTSVITDAGATVVTAGGTATLIILSVLASNKTGTSADMDVYLDKATGDDVYLIRNAPIPAGSALEIISGNKVILEAGDKIQARCGTSSAIDLTVSYLEQTP